MTLTKNQRQILGAALLTGMALGSQYGIGPAEAAPHVDPVSDSYRTTCNVLDEGIDGVPAHDLNTIIGVAKAIANYYDLTNEQGLTVELIQVHGYCQYLEPYVQAADQYARTLINPPRIFAT